MPLLSVPLFLASLSVLVLILPVTTLVGVSWTSDTSFAGPPPLPRFLPSPLAQNLIFRFLQTRQRVEVWLYAATDIRMRGFIVGFDEYMNVVLDEAVEVSVKRKTYVWVDERQLAAGNSHLVVAARPAPGWCGFAEGGGRVATLLRPASTDSRFLVWGLSCFLSWPGRLLPPPLPLLLLRRATPLGRILLKGDTISLLCSAPADDAAEGTAAG